MTSAIPGCEVRSSDSVQPVHSWKWSQTTDGLSPLPAASTIFAAVVDDRPTAAAAIVQTFTKSRRVCIPLSLLDGSVRQGLSNRSAVLRVIERCAICNVSRAADEGPPGPRRFAGHIGTR